MLEWNRIVNNAVSVLVAAVFVGAAAIVWTKVTTIDDTVSKHTSRLEINQENLISTQAELKSSQETLTNAIVDTKKELLSLRGQIDSLQSILKDLSGSKKLSANIPENRPLILPKYQIKKEYLDKFTKSEEVKINKTIQELKPKYRVEFLDKMAQQIQRQTAFDFRRQPQ